jgi:hypothetical protein
LCVAINVNISLGAYGVWLARMSAPIDPQAVLREQDKSRRMAIEWQRLSSPNRAYTHTSHFLNGLNAFYALPAYSVTKSSDVHCIVYANSVSL